MKKKKKELNPNTTVSLESTFTPLLIIKTALTEPPIYEYHMKGTR